MCLRRLLCACATPAYATPCWNLKKITCIRVLLLNKEVYYLQVYIDKYYVQKRASEPRFLYGGKLSGKPDL
jgi:hypothetical protein